MSEYLFQDIEKKWQKIWEDLDLYKTDMTDTEKKLYCLVMFLYPSGDRLHIGHWWNYGPTDTWARFKRMQGYNVLEPMGYDAFGLPAENYAIKMGVHPADSTAENIKNIRKQWALCMTGLKKSIPVRPSTINGRNGFSSYSIKTIWLTGRMHP